MSAPVGFRSDPASPVAQELKIISKENGGVIMPSVVVDRARPPENPLHPHFEWNDSVAAEKFRLEQARYIIRMTITQETSQPTPRRVFVALRSERPAGGGYRELTSVMSDEKMRADLLAQAKADALTFQRKYAHLEEMADVIRAIGRLG